MDTTPSPTPERPYPFYDAHVAAWKREQEQKANVAAHMEASMRPGVRAPAPLVPPADPNTVDQKFGAFIEWLDRTEERLGKTEFLQLVDRIANHAHARCQYDAILDPSWKAAAR